MDPALHELLRSGARDDAVSAIVRLDPREPPPAHVHVVAQFGDIATVRLRCGDVAEAYATDGIASFKATRLLLPEHPVVEDGTSDRPGADHATTRDFRDRPPLDGVSHADLDQGPGEALDAVMRASDVRRQDDWPTGRGVMVAALDWGLDFTHVEFREPDGRTRLAALWDQSARYDPAFPNHYGYGRVYRSNEIDRALATDDPFVSLGYDPRHADRGAGTHGTHVMGIAAGNGRAGGPAGVAPEAGLLFVHLAPSMGQAGASALTDSAAVLEALHFVDVEAAARPACINMSLGTHGGPHDGTALVEQGIDAFVAASPRRVVVQSTGNYFARRVHACGTLAAGGRIVLPVLVDRDDTTANDIEIWYRGCDTFVVHVHAPDGRVLATAALDGHCSVVDCGSEIGRLYHRRRDPNNQDNHVQLRLDAPAAVGTWSLALEGLHVEDGRFDAWIERDSQCASCQPQFPPELAMSHSTTGSICNGRGSLVVGAFDAHQPHQPIGRFSSSGPTRDGRAKPDLVAPGVRVLSARSSPLHASAAWAPLTRMSGTSMAAPHVAGAAALLCEAASHALSCDQVRRLLCTTAASDASLTDADRLRSGAGRLDIAAALAAVRALVTPLPLPDPEIVMESATPSSTSSCATQSAHMRESDEDTGAGAHGATGCAAGPLDTNDNAEARHAASAVDSTVADHDDVANEDVEYVVRRRRRDRGSRLSGPIIAPVIGSSGIGAAVVTPMGGGLGLALPLGGAPAAPAAAATAAPASVPAAACACAEPAGTADAPVVVASTEPTWPGTPQPESEGVWMLTERDAAQAAESMLGAYGHDAHEALGEAALEALEGADAWDDGTDPIEYAEGFDEIAEAIVGDDPLQSAARFVFDLLARAGVTITGEADLDEHAHHSAAIPARLFDHFSGRRPALPDAIARRFDLVAGPGAPIPALAAGDWLVRRGDGGFGNVSVLASPRVWPPQALQHDGFRLEHARQGGFVHVIEPGHCASQRAHRFARRVCDTSQRVLPDTIVLRPQPVLPRPRVHLGAEGYDEAVDARWIQDALNRILGMGLTVDGVIGPQSRAAIRAFQGQRGLTPDGVVGPRTEGALRAALAGGAAAPGTGRQQGHLMPGSGGGRTNTAVATTTAAADCTTLDSFDQGRDTLKPAHDALLLGIARRIQREGVRVAIVTGFASSEGDELSNLTLGQRRADAVARKLRDALAGMPGGGGGVAIPTFSRGENDQTTSPVRAHNRRVTVCLQPRPVAPPQPPAVPARTKLFTVTGKSFIARIGGNRGSLACGASIGPVPIPGSNLASNAALLALAAATDAAFDEDPLDDRVSPRSRGYRLFSQGQVQALHRGDQLLNLSLGAGLTTDSGKECPLQSTDVGCLKPPALIIDQPFVTQRVSASRIRFRWGVKGRPHDFAEPTFQAVCLRDSVFIWHLIKGEIDASSGVPVISSLIIEGSRFPSHRVWVDNVAQRPPVRQGPMSNLWDGAPGDPTRVR